MIAGLNQTVFSHLSYGLYIVTSKLDDRLNGQIVNTVLQVTSQPPRVAVIINKNNLTHEFISNSKVFGVSVLDDSADLKFIGLFGFRTGRDIDKLSQVQFALGSSGCPLVTEHSISILDAKVIDTMDVGTHTVFVADVLGSEVLKEGTPLTYEFYRTNLRGKSSKNSPTYVEQKKSE